VDEVEIVVHRWDEHLAWSSVQAGNQRIAAGVPAVVTARGYDGNVR